MNHERLAPEALYRRTELPSLPFKTTNDLEAKNGIDAQKRALESLGFGLGMRREGYNIFVMGPEGTGKLTAVRKLLEARAQTEPVPNDLCYVFNFDVPYAPRALELKPGSAKRLKHDMKQLVEDLKSALHAAFEAPDHRAKRRAVSDELQEKRNSLVAEVDARARERGAAVLTTDDGLLVAPLKDGEPFAEDEFDELPLDEQSRMITALEPVKQDLQDTLEQVPRLESETRKRLRLIDSELGENSVRPFFDDLKKAWAFAPEVVEYLESVRRDVVDNVARFLPKDEESTPDAQQQRPPDDKAAFAAYQPNLFIDQSERTGAPVVFEDNPTYANLFGRMDHAPDSVGPVTDFALIKAGALHRANGGYLVLDVHKLLHDEQAWDALKRMLRSHEIRLESPERQMTLHGMVSLEPEVVPLDVKVVLLGERDIFYSLLDADREFSGLFKVAVDFDDDFERDEETEALVARVIASIAKREDLLPLERAAVLRIVEHGARVAEDAGRITANWRRLADIAREADDTARRAGETVITLAHVESSFAARARRMGRVRERIQQHILDGSVLIDTAGSIVGQVNGLTVIELGEVAVGSPTRITARIGLGSGKIVNIEREVDMSGAIHSKGVLTFIGFLRERYGRDTPLAFDASLAFEQSYMPVDGDSASCAELCALLSAIANVKLSQGLAVTGSVNQRGEMQVVGGVNDKIEGFFDLCARGLDGKQGVIVPIANSRHLMLRKDVADAVREGKFSVFAARTVDDVLAMLSGIQPGVRQEEGFPEGSFNARVVTTLETFAQKQKALRTHV
jgi:lon-related putative ATP-dependent protease